MSIAPVVVVVTVKAPPVKAFTLFTQHMVQWWEKSHSIGGAPPVEIIIEPHVGGRWFERDAEGRETDWGKVLAYDPSRRVLLGWQINANWKCDPDFLTELEITFQPNAQGGTEVRLEHRNLEQFGTAADSIATSLNSGWALQLRNFGAYADQTIE